ncbi:MAG: glycosyltransferase family 2 protein [Bacteroidia bacterium]|nr:glycosyltransferase family 2 protein [Bacteroidia bacterium]
MSRQKYNDSPVVYVIIPAFNEADSIAKVVQGIPSGLVREVVVVSNGSTDATELNAARAGATVLREERKGYGFACLKGLDYLAGKKGAERPDIVVFLDGDYSDYPEEMPDLVNPVVNEGYDMVIGSRALGNREKGSMMPQQVFGNWLATTLIRWLYGISFSDLGPFRAITWEALQKINMQDQTFGWTVEMQVKAAKLKLKCLDVPVKYRRRIGVSKVTGTIKGTIMAGYKILWTIFKLI